MTKKDWFWIILILVLLILIVIISGIFYFSLVVGGFGTGHVIFEGEDLNNSSGQNTNIPVIEGDVIFKEVESVIDG